ncbi:unnamed protein product [Leptidea sinapis]|uniref:Lipase domain-containing protein n=1 Tax=Leptidea sinapis TaxID=189913 RepID=A0A5E4QBJ4_9NEOP|nr:unnamed protein product [Leptidea sinapis]
MPPLRVWALLIFTHFIIIALFLNSDTFGNATLDDCVWKRDRDVDLFSEDWLRQSDWEPSHETILLIHGYAGGDDTLPIIVLRDAMSTSMLRGRRTQPAPSSQVCG